MIQNQVNMEILKPTSNVNIIEQVKKPGFKLTPKKVFIILGLVILLEILFGIRTLSSPPSITQATKAIEPLSSGKIILFSDQKNFQLNEIVPVSIRLATGGRNIIAADAVLRYDPNFLEATGSAFFAGGDTFGDYPTTEVDSQNGVIRISGIGGIDDSFNGIGELASLNLKAKKLGKTTLSVEFTPGDTTDSNIIETNSTQDILGEVFNLDLTIGSQTKDDDSIDDEGYCDSFLQSCTNEEGERGIMECSSGRLKNNVCSFDPIWSDFCGQCETE